MSIIPNFLKKRLSRAGFDSKNKPSGYFANLPTSPTGKRTDIIESNPKTGVTYSYHSNSSYSSSDSSRDATGRDRCPVKPGIISDTSSMLSLLKRKEKEK
jgi:hypothetical protein